MTEVETRPEHRSKATQKQLQQYPGWLIEKSTPWTAHTKMILIKQEKYHVDSENV